MKTPSALRPGPEEYDPFYQGYVARVAADEDLLSALEAQGRELAALIRSIPAERWEHRYAPGKWSVSELFLHICDAEWVFMGRAFWFARSGPGPLPGMDQDEFMAAAEGVARDAESLARQFEGLRQAAVEVLGALPTSAWTRGGEASGAPVSVRALCCIALGHVRHHLAVLAERYGVSA